MTQLTLTEAAAELAKLTSKPTESVSIIRAGAAGKIPVHWYNDLHQDTYISDFTSDPQGKRSSDLQGTHSSGPMQMTTVSLRSLTLKDSVDVIDFVFTDADFDLLEKIKGRAVDDDGFLLGYRHLAEHKGGTVAITRAELFVYGHDLTAYAAMLAGVDQVQPAPAVQNNIVHTTQIKQKDHHLHLSISEAQKGLDDPFNATAVWANLQALANKKFSNLLGVTEDGIQFLKKGEASNFTRAALNEYLNRQKNKTMPTTQGHA